jgi:hypothetical protein
MGLLDRVRTLRRAREHEPNAPTVQVASAHLLEGDEDLEVVGEASYQPTLWGLCRGRPGDRIRHSIVAILVPQPDNSYDANAISVQIQGHIVGYLARDVAAEYGPGLRQRMDEFGAYVALRGVIVGGGYYHDGPGRLGVWLEHEPGDFGVGRVRGSGSARLPAQITGTMRTGFSEAWLTDLEDDSYDLSWFNDLPDADRPAIAMLRELLATDPDPIDRHFQFAELECRLYRSRDLFPEALQEYDAACQLHDAEMETICQAFMQKWGKVPLLETYRQMAIRQQKVKDWKACLWWAERGLFLYGNNAAREDAVEDLLKRRNRALAKLEAKLQATPVPTEATVTMPISKVAANAGPPGKQLETLTCSRCAATFERPRTRGRKPKLCPDCRVIAA